MVAMCAAVAETLPCSAEQAAHVGCRVRSMRGTASVRVVAAKEFVVRSQLLHGDVVAQLAARTVLILQKAAAGLGAATSHDEDQAGRPAAVAITEPGGGCREWIVE